MPKPSIDKYSVGEKVFFFPRRQVVTIKEILVDKNRILIEYRAGDGEMEEQLVKVNSIDKAKRRRKDEILFAKVKPDAKIPSRRAEDGCYDLNACFEEDYIRIPSGGIKLIPTGIASSFSPKYRANIRERGSTGVKGLSVRAGQIDSGYRGEWIVVLNNTSSSDITIVKEGDFKEKFEQNNVSMTLYPYEKAIAQAALEVVPYVDVREISYEALQKIPSQRGMGKLGASGK